MELSNTYISIFGRLMFDNDEYFPKEVEGIYFDEDKAFEGIELEFLVLEED